MRYQIRKLTKGHSTKAERRFMELLKELHIPFKSKVMIADREVDFVVNKFAIEIDGHTQDPKKNIEIIRAGYTPFHFYNYEINSGLKDWLNKIKNI